MTLFEDFVNTELPRRSALLTNTIVSYDDNPNLASAPAVLQGAPLGTWFYEETENIWWRKIGSGANDWEEQNGSGVNGEEIITKEDLTFPVDYTDATAVDAPDGYTFATQGQIDDFLAQNGTSNFKHVGETYNSLPIIVQHTVTFNLAAGDHLVSGNASSGSYAFDFTGKSIVGHGYVDIIGPSASSYEQIVASQTVISHTSTSNPEVTIATNEFDGYDLKGKFAVFDNGFVGLIHDNDGYTIYITQMLYPAPTDSSTTFFVARPAARLRNALDSTPTTKYKNYAITAGDAGGGGLSPGEYGAISLENMQIDGLGALGYIYDSFSFGSIVYNRVTIDHEYERVTHGITPNGRGFWGATTRIYMLDCSVYVDPNNLGGVDQHIVCFGNGGDMYLWNVVVANGAAGGIVVENGGIIFTVGGIIVHNISYSSNPSSVLVSNNSKVDFLEVAGGKPNTIRSAPGPGLLFKQGSGVKREHICDMRFENCTGPCVSVQDGVILSNDGTYYGLIDGGGNLDVGIEITGMGNRVLLDSGTDVTGANGDVRIGGTIFSYTDIDNFGPLLHGSSEVSRG